MAGEALGFVGSRWFCRLAFLLLLKGGGGGRICWGVVTISKETRTSSDVVTLQHLKIVGPFWSWRQLIGLSISSVLSALLPHLSDWYLCMTCCFFT